MTIDRLLIICSLLELTYIGRTAGVAYFTPFQWAALALLTAKLFLWLRARLGRKDD